MPAWVFVTNIPSPYQVDFFSSLQQIIPGRFHVLFSAASESDRFFRIDEAPSFPHTVLKGTADGLRKDWHRNPQLPTLLNQLAPSLVVLGGSYFMPDARAVRHWCLKREISWVYWGEDPDKRRTAGLRGMMKRAYLKWFLRCNAIVGIGSAATQNYAALRPHLPNISIPYAPNLERVLKASEGIKARAAALRRTWQDGDEPSLLILFAGHFSERKAPDLLMRSYLSVSRQLPNSRLIMAGDGPLLPAIRDLAKAPHLGQRVCFPGFLRGDELIATYLACDLFVLPTRHHEGWGVVVQEAMAAGLPVIISSVVGAGHDLVAGKDTGLVFEANNVEALSWSLSNLCRDPELRHRYSRNARAVVMPTSSKSAAVRLVDFLSTIKQPKRQ